MPLDEIEFEAEETMEKAVEHCRHEFRGLRTGRPTTALVEYIKLDYYGAQSDLKSVAVLTVQPPNSIVIKPFEASMLKEVVKALEEANLGINPQIEGKQVRLMLPALSGERRQQLASKVKDVAEHARIAMRNVRRDANKKIDNEEKAGLMTEDNVERAHESIQELLKRYEAKVEELVATKTKEIMES
jgi:ribosome recycling factor